MSATLQTLGIDKLTITERLAILDDLWENIAAEPDQIPLLESQRDDLQRRLNAIDADPERGSSWEDVKSRLTGVK